MHRFLPGCHSYLANVAGQMRLGKLTGFAYLLDFDRIAGLSGALDPRRGSTSTYGGRFVGGWTARSVEIGFIASYATQTAANSLAASRGLRL